MTTAAAIRFAFVLPFALGSGLLACSSDDNHDDEHSDEHSNETGDTHGSDCDEETRDDEYMVGLSKSGSALTVTFVSANPAPPALGDNNWTVTLSDSSAGITAVTPFMPDHGHGTAVEAIITATDNAGEWTLSPVNLYMAGLWEVTIDLITQAGTTDQVVFSFCVE
jgi:subtilisin family serine protease